MAVKNTMTKMTDSGGVTKPKPAPKSYADRSREIRKNQGQQAIRQGEILGLSSQESLRAFGGDPSNNYYMKNAADALGSITKTPYSYQDASERNSYLAALKAQLDAQTAAYDQLLAYNQKMYDEQKKLAAQNREDNARRAYIAKEMALKNLPGQLAREGINGGLAETSYVRLNNRYNRSLAEGDSDYSDAVSRAYLDMVKANREPQTGKMNAQASYSAGVAKAPGVKTINGTKVTDTGDIRAFAEAMAKLGYTSEQAADIWNRRYG